MAARHLIGFPTLLEPHTAYTAFMNTINEEQPWFFGLFGTRAAFFRPQDRSPEVRAILLPLPERHDEPIFDLAASVNFVNFEALCYRNPRESNMIYVYVGFWCAPAAQQRVAVS
jgi:hypothetical protein